MYGQVMRQSAPKAVINPRANQGFVEAKNVLGQSVLTDQQSQFVSPHTPARVEYGPTPSVATGVFASAGFKIETIIPAGQSRFIKGLVDQNQLSESGGVSPVAPTKTPFFYDRIEIK